MNYGKGVRLARVARNMAQNELARLADMDASYLSLIESGARVPSMSTIESLASGLRVPVYLLMLLSSDKEDIRGLSTDDADTLGRHLLDALTSIAPKE